MEVMVQPSADEKGNQALYECALCTMEGSKTSATERLAVRRLSDDKEMKVALCQKHYLEVYAGKGHETISLTLI